MSRAGFRLLAQHNGISGFLIAAAAALIAKFGSGQLRRLFTVCIVGGLLLQSALLLLHHVPHTVAMWPLVALNTGLAVAGALSLPNVTSTSHTQVPISLPEAFATVAETEGFLQEDTTQNAPDPQKLE